MIVNQVGGDTQVTTNGVKQDLGNINPLPTAAPGGILPSVGSVASVFDQTPTADTAGGDAILITGTNFTADSQITFGGVAALSQVVVSSTEIYAAPPPRPFAPLQDRGRADRRSSAEQLEAVPGLPPKVGRRIHEALHKTG